MTDAPVLARVRVAVINVELAVLPLKSRRTLALVSADQVVAGGSILAGLSLALVDLLLAIAAGVPVVAEAFVAVPHIPAVAAVLTQLVDAHALHVGGGVAGDPLHVAVLASPPALTVTGEGRPGLEAPGVVLTRGISAPVDEPLAVGPGPPVGAVARVVAAGLGNASATVPAGLLVAGVDLALAIGSGVAVRADTGVVVDAVYALAPVHARGLGAVRVVGLAVGAGKAEPAFACVRVDIVVAGGPVQAGVGSALVDVSLAYVASESLDAEALEAVDGVDASAPVHAGRLLAVVRVYEAVAALKSGRTIARVRPPSVVASRPVSAGRVQALVDILIAVAAGKSEGT